MTPPGTPGEAAAAAPAVQQSNTRIIARNSFWFGVETALQFLTVFLTSIPMARVLGPQQLGYFNYIMWLANVGAVIAALGIPRMTRKYMAEFLNAGQAGLARAAFFASLRAQILVAAVVTGGGLFLVFAVSDPRHWQVSAFLVASTFPAMVNAIGAQANTARENMAANVPASLAANLIHITFVGASLLLGWNLLGIAIGIFVFRMVELIMRLVPILRWLEPLPHTELPRDVRRRMFAFSGQSMVLLLLNVVIWDRSDIVFLKWLNSDIRQITFYLVAFNLTQNALQFPQVFAQAVGATVMAQYGRDKTRLGELAATSLRYMGLLALPMFIGMAALASPAIRLLYGVQYLASIPLLAVAALFTIPRVFLLPVTDLLQANEKQAFLIGWSIICAGLNVLLDVTLIPRYAAMGAALANGIAQGAAVIGMWIYAWRLFRMDLRARALAKVCAAALLMGLLVAGISSRAPVLLALAAGIPLGALIYGLMLRFTGALEAVDGRRLLQFRHKVPSRLRSLFERAVELLVAAPITQRGVA